MIPLVFAVISGLLVIGTAIYQYREKIFAEKKANERQVSLDSANAKIVDLLNQVSKKNEEIINVQQKLNNKSEYISNYITGGEGFPYISLAELRSENQNNFNLAFILNNDGEFPLYDIDGTMLDYNILKQKQIENKGMGAEFDKYPEFKIIKFDDYKSAVILKLSEDLPSKSMRYIDLKFPIKEFKYHFILNSRNGTITERIALIKDETAKFIFLVEVFDSKEKLLKRIEGKFVNNLNRNMIEDAINEIPKSLKYVFIN